MTTQEGGDASVASALVSVDEAIEECRRGQPVIIVDDQDRENEGDICVPAQFLTAEHINFVTTHARGLTCITMTGERLDALRIPLMTGRNTSPLAKAFTVTVDAREGIGSGASAADRARTIATLIDPTSRPEDLTRPGHVAPLRAREGGVLVRSGHTEASVDLCKLAGLEPAAVITEVLNLDGSMARMSDLAQLAQDHDLKIVTVNKLIAHRLQKDRLIERVAEAALPTRYGDFSAVAYRTIVDHREHVAIVMGDLRADGPVLVRVHNQCVAGDIFRTSSCDCSHQLDTSMRMIAEARRGVVVYMHNEGGLAREHRAGTAAESAHHAAPGAGQTVPTSLTADRRDDGLGLQILVDLGVRKIRLLTDDPSKRLGVDGYGLDIVELVPLGG